MDSEKLKKVNWDEILATYEWLNDYKNPKLIGELIKNILAFSGSKKEPFLQDLGVKRLSEKDAKQIVAFLLERDKIKVRRKVMETVAKTGVIAGIAGALGIGGYSAYKHLTNTPAQNLFEQLKRYSQLKMSDNLSLFSKNLDSKIIIILSDRHGSEDIEIIKLEIINKVLNTLKRRFIIGLEGWAGYDVDNKRGRLIINGEKTLILKSMTNSFKDIIIGLEDSIIQITALEMLLLRQYVDFYDWRGSSESLFTKLGINYNELINFLNFIDEKMFEKFNKKERINEIEKEIIKFINKHRYIALDFKHTHESFVMYINLMGYILDSISDIYGIKEPNFNNLMFVSIFEQLKGKYWKIYSYPADTPFKKMPEFENVSMNLRNQFTVRKMLSFMTQNKIEVGIIVFGIDHTQGLIEEFKRQSGDNINVLVSTLEV